MSTPKILAFAGSSRTESFNKKILKYAVAGAQSAGAEVTVIDLRDFSLPLFDQEVEAAGFSTNALALKKLFGEHQGLLIAAPEYNSSITPLLKNTIDWVSRSSGSTDPSLAAFVGKTAALVSASPGALGGLRGLVHLRAILGNIQVLVIPDQLAVSKAHEAFDDAGQLKDQRQQAGLENVGARLTEVLRKLGN